MANAQIIQHLRPGGIESLALSILNQQPNDLLISLEGNKEQAIEAWPRLKAFEDRLVFLEKPAGFSMPTAVSLAKKLRENSIDSIHTHHIGPYLYAGAARLMYRVKQHVHTEHDGWHLQNAKHCKIQKVLNTFLRPTLVADAQEVADIVEEKTGAQSHVIYNGVDTQQFSPCSGAVEKARLRAKLGLDQSKVWVGCAGRLEPVKGHAYLIRAMSYLPECFNLVIAGTGTQRESLESIASMFSVRDRVVFLGHIDKTEELYKAIDIFCQPSLNEGFPLAPLEAQACGTRAAITNVGGAKETLCPTTGLLVPAEDELRLASAITKLYLTDYQQSPRNFVVENFSLHSMNNAYQRLLSA